jgi:small conductance mechanosensitive channel
VSDTTRGHETAFYARNASITSFDDSIPDYHFQAKEVKMISKNIMVARPAVLYIGEVPVMWLPFIFQDMRSGRRSGVLTPRFGVSEPRWDPAALSQWAFGHGVNILIILIGGWVVIRAASLAIEHLQHKLAGRRAHSDFEWQRRAATLTGILTSVVTVSVGFIALLMLLRELSLDVMPILTGAGIAGLAIGFGAQNVVRDVISGFFLILEDQVRVGDAARINGVSGTVEQINLRTIVLRDGEGAVQVFPNGTVTALANLSKQFAYAIVDVRVAYNENIDRVMGTIREVGASMALDPAWKPLVLAPVDILGVESLADGFATVRVRFKTVPLNQATVANELRRRLMGAFVGRGIRPYAG